MKKLKPSKEVLLQYLYDYGIKDTCKLLHITEEEFNSILEPSKREHSHHKYNYQISEIKPLIAKDISDNSLLKVISDGIEDNVVKQIEYRLKMVRYQLQMDNKQLKGIQTNALSKEARENKADLY